MGAGLAKQFRAQYPDMYTEYVKVCKGKQLQPGHIWVYLYTNIHIINFATKDHWKNPSKLEWIQGGLDRLADYTLQHKLHSIIIPPLGCGLGGLDIREVYPMIEDFAERVELQGTKVYFAGNRPI